MEGLNVFGQSKNPEWNIQYVGKNKRTHRFALFYQGMNMELTIGPGGLVAKLDTVKLGGQVVGKLKSSTFGIPIKGSGSFQLGNDIIQVEITASILWGILKLTKAIFMDSSGRTIRAI